MKNIVTIWWWNWHSAVLKWLYNNFKENDSFEDFNISAIVSMSDDGRTTWLLMREMKSELWIHMPPPWDLRRCLFSLSDSEFRDEFSKLFETVMHFEWSIWNFSILDILIELWEPDDFIENLRSHNADFLNYKLPIACPVSWHKFWNILMASLYYNLWDYDSMIDFMTYLLDVKWNIFPVTINPAFIYAELTDWTIIETQDKISNVIEYDKPIKNIELMDDSKNASLNKWVSEAVENADYIVIWPWDLYTSIDSNFIIDWFQELVVNSKAQIIFILNSNNKKGETTGYEILDFIDVIQERTWWKIDYVVWNDVEPDLDNAHLKRFKNDISVKWWNYLILDEKTKRQINKKYPKISILSWDYLDVDTLYKNKQVLLDDIVGLIKK